MRQSPNCTPFHIVELADRMGRDYTTISQQVSKLEALGLFERRERAAARRVREAIITAPGKAMTDSVDAAREAMARAVFADWEQGEVRDLVRVMRRFADAVQ